MLAKVVLKMHVSLTKKTVEEEIEINEEIVHVEQKKEVEKQMKTFIDFMNDWKQINVMPKSEFRDKAYEALNTECKETLQVDLPALDVVVVKDSAIEKSVGTAGNKEFKDEEEKTT